jgi:hypothetical protein
MNEYDDSKVVWKHFFAIDFGAGTGTSHGSDSIVETRMARRNGWMIESVDSGERCRCKYEAVRLNYPFIDNIEHDLDLILYFFITTDKSLICATLISSLAGSAPRCGVNSLTRRMLRRNPPTPYHANAFVLMMPRLKSLVMVSSLFIIHYFPALFHFGHSLLKFIIVQGI